VPAFAVVDARARQRITDSIALVADLQNLFNADYHTFGVLGEAELLGDEFEGEHRFYSPGAPRGAWVGIEVEF
jgi:outer membrane receptor protein involved in Fe transport